ncbi:MAG: hypothetical protein ACRDQ2_05720 [Gaiellales bacterium]
MSTASSYLPGEDDEIREAGRVFATAIRDVYQRECGGSGVWELYSDDLDVEIERLKTQVEQIENAAYETRNMIREVTWRAYTRTAPKIQANADRYVDTDDTETGPGGDLR